MATRTYTLLIDDFDGTEASESITISLDGKTYEIDLNEANSTELRSALDPYVKAGRRVGSTKGRYVRNTESANISRDVRRWAAENNVPVNAAGRISAGVMEQYAAAH